MIYFDYSATTPINKEVLNDFNVNSQNFANPNSIHTLGKQANQLVVDSDNSIRNSLNLKNETIIYTSGASEANNLAITGLADAYPEKKHLITSRFEHSSVIAPISYLVKKNYEVDYVKINQDGQIDIDHLLTLIRKDTLLVAIAAVNSEVGLRQDINLIAAKLKDKPCFFMVDATQAIGKYPIDFTNIDLLSFSGHKIYGFKGIGALIKKDNIKLIPIIRGGNSTTKFRSGTPASNLIASLALALKIKIRFLESDLQRVTNLNLYLRKEISGIKNIKINSFDSGSVYILNISILNSLAEATVEYLDKKGICISSRSACASSKDKSRQIFDLYHDTTRAKTSVRISLSHLSKYEEIDQLINNLKILAGENYENN